MRLTLKKLVVAVDKVRPLPEPIFEFGSYQVLGQESRSVRSHFEGRDYVGCDLRAGPGVDRQLNLHKIDLPDASVGTVIMLDTLEHVKYFWKAMDEVHRILKPGGVVIFTSLMHFPIHNYPSDYWRFTPEGFQVLCEKFDHSFVAGSGLKDLPHTIGAICTKGALDSATAKGYADVMENWRVRDGQSWKEIASMILPPFLLGPLYKAFNFCLEWLATRAKARAVASARLQKSATRQLERPASELLGPP